MNQPQNRYNLTVKNIQKLSPSFLRLTLGGDELSSFPEGFEGTHIKLLFQEDEPSVAKPVLRTYTIRHHRPELNELDVDFVCHAGGIASQWAQRAKVGSPITIRGPGSKKYFNPDAEWFLVVADMTALPAAAAMLETLPIDAKGYAVFEVRSEADKLSVTAPRNVLVNWLVNPDCEQESENMLEGIKQVGWLPGKPYVFAAGENSVTRKIRRYLLREKGLSRQEIYVSSYWKVGMQEEQHKIHKKGDEQEQG